MTETMIPHRILFVDDEPHVLQGTRRMLRSQRHVWGMAFATSGEEALTLFRENPFHVVVSDMRMPGMDGATLLETIQREAPETIRIILSGFSEQEAILRTVGPAHQYLAKPTAAEDLVAAISRSLTLRSYLANSNAEAILSQLKTLPSPPELYQSLVSAMKSFDGDGDEIVNIISRDPALAAQTLKLTNSAFYGLPEQTSSLHRAVQVLGFETLRALALKSDLFKAWEGVPSVTEKLNRLAHRSHLLGQVAAQIAKLEGLPPEMVDSALTAGLVSHVGTLSFMVGAPEQFAEVGQNVDDTLTELVDAEVAAFGCDHAQMGAYFLGLWAFMDGVVEAVAYHHHPRDHAAPPAPLTAIVHAAQALCKSGGAEPEANELDKDYIEASGFPVIAEPTKWARWCAVAVETIQNPAPAL